MTSISPDKLIAIVTGGNRGIGFEVSKQLAEHGIAVILTGRDESAAISAVEKLTADGYDVRPYMVDVSKDESVLSFAEKYTKEIGRLDILINNAGGSYDFNQTALNADLTKVHGELEMNLFGAWRMNDAFLPLLRNSKHPRIINVSSGGGSFGWEGGIFMSHNMAPYAVSKAALNAYTAKLGLALKGSNILVNAICPGFTATSPGLAEMGARPASESAKSVIWGALLPDDGPSGGFFRDGKPLAW